MTVAVRAATKKTEPSLIEGSTLTECYPVLEGERSSGRRRILPEVDLEEKREGQMHPCNGYILVEKSSDETASGLVVIREKEAMNSAIVVEVSVDETEEPIDHFEWHKGDLIYFRDAMEIDGHTFVHWTDVFAYRRFSFA